MGIGWPGRPCTPVPSVNSPRFLTRLFLTYCKWLHLLPVASVNTGQVLPGTLSSSLILFLSLFSEAEWSPFVGGGRRAEPQAGWHGEGRASMSEPNACATRTEGLHIRMGVLWARTLASDPPHGGQAQYAMTNAA